MADLSALAENRVRLLAKLEWFNPGGSVKDRVALQMIRSAEAQGLLPGATVIEPTSGNTGIALSAVCAARGYRCILVMPESMSLERRQLIAARGAELVLTPARLGMAGAVQKAQELARQIPGSYLPGQFDNPANPLAHYRTTGPEICRAAGGCVDVLVCGIGTGGTVTGCGRYLKEMCPAVQIIGIEPDRFPHGIQGIGAGFEPGVLDRSVLDETMCVCTQDAIDCCRSAARKSGLLIGISSGAALFGALKLAQREENSGKTVVTVFPDSGEHYLSAGLFSL